MPFTKSRNNVLDGDRHIGPLPMNRIRRVEKPTNLIITDEVQRSDTRETGAAKAVRGDWGEAVQKEMHKKWKKQKELIHASVQQLCPYLHANPSFPVSETKGLSSKSPAAVSRHIKGLGYFGGADVMGICRLPKYAVYTHDWEGNPIDVDYEYAIVIVVGKHYPTVKASNGRDWIINALSVQAYQRTALISHNIANYIKNMGYQASVQHGTGPYDVTMPPLLIMAGIGEVSRCGIILNPFLGMNFKAAAVLTNLPLESDRPIDFGLQDFCQHCTICADACPSNAITKGDKIMHNGYATWKLDPQKCGTFQVLNKNGYGCFVCTKVCPWTRPNTWPHNWVRWAVIHSKLARRIAVKVDTIWRRRPKACVDLRWWFDCVEVDGVYRIKDSDLANKD